jgi:hypothetical protein
MATIIRNAESDSYSRNRASLEYWIRQAIECGESCTPESLVDGALNRMARRDIPVLAEDADAVLALAAGTTLWHNHGGTVPASALLEEIERRHPGRERNPENGRLIETSQARG